MALFKIYRGDRANLPGGWDAEKQTVVDSSKLHDGFAYFCADTGELFIDVDLVGNGSALKRMQVNALAATKLSNGTDTIEIDDIVLTTDIIDVEHGGTGRNSLTLNAVLVGDGTNQAKLIPANLGAFYVDTDEGEPKFGVLPVTLGGIGTGTLENGGILRGNGANAVSALSGVGVLYSTTKGAPQFGVAPLSVGGTAASDAKGARENLDVYSKDEVNAELAKATTVSYPHTILVGDWIEDAGAFVATWNEAKLQCGKAHNVSPLITYTSNKDEYSKISYANADYENHQIKFYIDKRPSENIGILIIDQM